MALIMFSLSLQVFTSAGLPVLGVEIVLPAVNAASGASTAPEYATKVNPTRIHSSSNADNKKNKKEESNSNSISSSASLSSEIAVVVSVDLSASAYATPAALTSASQNAGSFH